ncbi:MAG: hypothetical protein OXG08_05185 [Gammaproteobacteria bacterium]|nr:hypothetical protein [Gammaproteobacteria bacterium]
MNIVSLDTIETKLNLADSTATHSRRRKRVLTPIRFLVVGIAIVLLSGCLSSTPRNFPTIQLPSSTPSPLPPSQSSTQPSGGAGTGQGQSSGLPTPSLPIPSSTSSPSLPIPPSTTLPGSESSTGMPSPPSLPTDGDGPTNADMPGMPTTGGAQQDQEEGEGEGGPEGGMEFPEPGSLETGGPLSTSEPEGDEASDGDDAGEGGMPAGSPMPGTSDDERSGGWEISNQLPEPGGLASQDDQSGIGELPGEFDDEAGDRGLNPEDAELRRVLGILDGEIMEERNDDLARANERAAAAGGPLGLEEAESQSQTEGGSADSGNTEESGATNDASNKGDGGQPNLPPTTRAVADTPDARDKEVYARQLREAAMAEEDPDLKEKLWEDYEDYIEGLK